METKYRLEFWDEDFKQWRPVALEICHGNSLCKTCKNTKQNLDCANFVYEIENKMIVVDKSKELKEDGDKIRIITIKDEELK